MGTSYDRRINLYINGEEIQNNVRSIASEMRKLANQQALMTIGSQEYTEAASKIKALKSILAEHNDSLKKTSGFLDDLKDTAMGLLPAFGVGALVAGVTSAFGKIKDSTHASADAFEFAMAGMSTGVDFFWKSLATGNFEHFTSGLKEAIVSGYKYAAMLDEVADNTRALRIIESNARGEELRMEEDLKNKGLSIEVRTKAGKDRIALEKKLSADRQIIANKNYQAEFDEATRVTKMNEEQLLSVAGVIESEEKMQASAYNEKVDNYNKIKALNVTQQVTIYGKGSPVQMPDTKEMIGIKAEIDSTKDSVKNYAGFLKSYDTMAESQQEKLISAVEKRNAAINSAPENLKKVITKVNSLLAGQEDHGGTASDPLVKKKLEAVETSNFKEIALIEQKHRVENTSEQQFKSELLTQELKFLNQKASIYKVGSKEYEEVQKQIQDKLIASGDEGMKIKISQAEAENKAANSLIDQRFISGTSTTAQYHAELLAQELKYGQAKMNIYQKGSKEYEEAQAQALDKQVKAELMVKNLLLAAHKELALSETNNLKDEILKKKSQEEAQFSEEIARLNNEKRVNEKMSQDDIDLNDTINKIIIAKTIAHQKAITDLDNSAIDAKKITNLRDSIMHAKTKEQQFNDELDLAKVEYNKEFKAAEGNRDKELDAEEKYKAKVIAIKKAQNKTYEIMSQAFVSFISDAFGGALDEYASFGESLILASLSVLKTLVPIWAAEIVGGSLATPDSIMTGGVLGIIKFTALLALMEGFVSLAESAVKSNISVKKDAASKSKSNTGTGYAVGGYTGDGGENEPAGIVHKGEYVLSKSMVKNPGLQPLISIFEYARLNRSTSIQLNPLLGNLVGNGNNGLSRSSHATVPINLPRQDDLTMTLSKINQTQQETNLVLKKVNEQLKKPISVNKYGHNGIEEAINDINRFRKLVQ